jgi:hypothetical protein
MANDATDILTQAVEALKWRQMACHVLVSVRRIDESDEKTLRRVVTEFGEMYRLVSARLEPARFSTSRDDYASLIEWKEPARHLEKILEANKIEIAELRAALELARTDGKATPKIPPR